MTELEKQLLLKLPFECSEYDFKEHIKIEVSLAEFQYGVSQDKRKDKVYIEITAVDYDDDEATSYVTHTFLLKSDFEPELQKQIIDEYKAKNKL